MKQLTLASPINLNPAATAVAMPDPQPTPANPAPAAALAAEQPELTAEQLAEAAEAHRAARVAAFTAWRELA